MAKTRIKFISGLRAYDKRRKRFYRVGLTTRGKLKAVGFHGKSQRYKLTSLRGKKLATT